MDIDLQLGDIIQIIHPSNSLLNNNIFIIDYIDTHKIIITDTETLNDIVLQINDGVIGDGNISQIYLLNRSKEHGYARQHGLITNVWVNVFFNGDIPTVITGLITNLEEDMIEIKTTDNNTIYINFDYHGLPQNLPIDAIIIREAPTAANAAITNGSVNATDATDATDATTAITNGTDVTDATVNEIIDSNKNTSNIIFNADQIKFSNDDYKTIVQRVNVNFKFQRYGVEEQVSDLMDELLSTVPDKKRNPRVLNNIYTVISRYQQLREQFSKFDDNGMIESIIHKSDEDYPLKSYFTEFKTDLKWIIPVVKHYVNYDEQIDQYDNEEGPPMPIIPNDISLIINEFNTSDVSSEQNRYAELYSRISNTLSKFNGFNNDNDEVIYSKDVQTNIIGIIDNIESMYSLVVNTLLVKNRQFILHSYANELTKLDVLNRNGQSVRIKITNPDTIHIKSFITLPITYVQQSRMFLPETNIMNRSNLNLEWKFLNIKSENNIKKVISNGNSNNGLYRPNKIMQYLTGTKEQYIDYVNNIVPSIKTLFKRLQQYLKGHTSMLTIIQFLEPYMIYSDDITYQTYIEMAQFVKNNIDIYTDTLSSRAKIFNEMSKFKSSPLHAHIMAKLFNEYNNDSSVTAGINETMYNIYTTDYGKLYASAISLQNLHLMLPQNIVVELGKTDISNSCSNVIIAKSYNSIDVLNADNGKTIYFDNQHDTTNYNMYEKDLTSSMLQKKLKISEGESKYLMDTLLNGKKQVIDGQYAVLVLKEEDETKYYIRTNSEWVENNIGIDNKLITDPVALCDIQNKCAYETPSNNCNSITNVSNVIRNDLIKRATDTFDSVYFKSIAELNTYITSNYEFQQTNIIKWNAIQLRKKNRYNNNQYKIGLTLESHNEMSLSPYSNLLDLIMQQQQQDFPKTQSDIIRFVAMYTRHAAYDELPEWLYCNKTNYALLPMFKYDIAVSFITNASNHRLFMKQLITKTGKLSDDGNMWVDKHSGWTIMNIDFDESEGFDENGNIIRTHEILEEDIGAAATAATEEIFVNANTNANIIKYVSPDAKSVSSIIQKVSYAMGIFIDPYRDYIISNVLLRMAHVEKEETFTNSLNDALKQGKKVPFVNYAMFYNTFLFYYAIGMYIIAIQTADPPVKTKKTFPGCVKSLMGYPGSGGNDLTNLTYMACILYNIRNTSVPWNVLIGKKVEAIQKNIKISIDDIIAENKLIIIIPEAANGANGAINELNLNHWTQYLPPLNVFKIHSANLTPLSDEFLQSKSHISDKIVSIKSKIIFYSLAIIESINDVVSKSELIMTNAAGIPYLETSCCKSLCDDYAMSFFTKHSKSINQYIDIVNSIDKYLQICTGKLKTLCSKINTKRIAINTNKNVVDKIAMYMTFIYYCKYNSTAPVPIEYAAICGAKPNISSTDGSIKEIIQVMSPPNVEAFFKLTQLIGQRNMVTIISKEKEENILNIPDQINNIIKTPTNNVSICAQISKQNELLEKNIKQFMQGCIKSNMESIINNMTTWVTTDTDNIYSFYKCCISNFVSVFPNIILHKISHDINRKNPTFKGFSDAHIYKLETNMQLYYGKLNTFYTKPQLINILNYVQQQCLYIENLSNALSTLPLETEAKMLAYKYCILSILQVYIGLSRDREMLYINTVTSNEESIGLIKELGEVVCKLIIVYMNGFDNHKNIINISSETLVDIVFKMKEREKNSMIERVQKLSDEERVMDTIFKINKLGMYGKSLQKGLTAYDKDYYDEEREMRDSIEKTERMIKQKYGMVTDDLLDEAAADEAVAAEEAAEYAMGNLGDDYGDDYGDNMGNDDN